ncbi:nucleotidyltransferase domain-containing protein [Lentzea sp. NPDC051213]|uniref:nucleotidyltransferase domain-containing protein n=1 Tax=Lentzea sp. NPDC051213 TaxID=3364126 RepID=UPI0037BB1EA6
MKLTEWPWQPLRPEEVAGLFGGIHWWIAGGYAIEFAVGRTLRPHGDIDVLLLRRDQLAAQRALSGWEWWAADPPGALRPWRPGEILPADVHDIWCRPSASAPWRVQVMLDESDGDDWVSRRDPRVRRPVGTLTHTTESGIPYLAPEIQLCYKSKAPREKDQIDFDAVLPLLSDVQRRWLADAIGGPHPWLTRLSE